MTQTFAPQPPQEVMRRYSALQAHRDQAQADLDASRRARRAAAWPPERQRLMAERYAARQAQAAAGLDTLEPEPLPVSAPLWFVQMDDSPREIAPIPDADPTDPQNAPGRDALGRPYATERLLTAEEQFAAATPRKSLKHSMGWRK